MGFTTNINQSNLQTTRELLNRQAQVATQDKNLKFQEVEAQKDKDFQRESYNIQAGDLWMTDNPPQTISKDQIGNLGDEVSIIYNENVGKLVEGRKLLASGKIGDRLEGMKVITEANNSIKTLKEDYLTLEDDVTGYLSKDYLSSNSDTEVTRIAESFTDGKVRIVSDKTAGQEGDDGRWIEYEVDGKKEYASMKDLKNALKNGIERVDVEGWIKATSANLGKGKVINPDGTFNEKLNDDAIQAAIDDLLSDPKKKIALDQQYKGKSVEEQLKIRLGHSQSLVESKLKAKKPVGRQPSIKDLNRADAMSFRKWEVEQAVADNGLEFLNNRLLGKSAKYGSGVNKPVKSVRIENGQVFMTFDDNSERSVVYRKQNVNDLFNQFTYNLEEQKMDWGVVRNKDSKNVLAEQEDITTKVVTPEVPRGVQKQIDLFSKGGIVTDPRRFIIGLKDQYPELLNASNISNTDLLKRLWDGEQISIFGESFDIKSKEGLNKFVKELSDKIAIFENRPIDEGVGSKYNKKPK